MQYIAIKCELRDGKEVFVVNAISLKNKNKAVVQKIPHPLGSDVLIYNTLGEAKEAITLAGFSYVLPDGRKEVQKPKVTSKRTGYDHIVLNTILSKINSTNSNVSASAVMALAEFPGQETFDVLFDKIGEDNDMVRKHAISGICRHSSVLQDRIINSLKSPNWVVKNSALTCITNIVECSSDTELEEFIMPLVEVCDDSNTIIQALALSTLAKVYQAYQKRKCS